jgi:ABC-type Co2+ transport system permease subunit
MINIQSLIKYLLEGLAVAVAAFYLTKKKTDPRDILMLAVVAATTFLILDQYAPGVASGARQGSGFGIGFNMVGGSMKKRKTKQKTTQQKH